MGAIWKFFSGENDIPPAPPVPEQSVQRNSLWGLMTGQHTSEPFSQRTAAAYHEAGHARAIRVGGGVVKSMEVYDDGHGGTMPDRDPYWTWGLRRTTKEQQRRADLVTYVAGQESECQYLMDRHRYSYEDALDVTDKWAGSDRQGFKERAKGTEYTWEGMQGEARRLVQRHAYTIETNAKPLDRNSRRGGTWA